MKTIRTLKTLAWILILTMIVSMNLVGTVFAAAPTNVQITGTLRPGYPLTVSYTGDPGATYAWFRCTTNAAGDTGTAITGATASTYTLVNADGGKYIKCAVTTGTDMTLSTATSVIAAPLTTVASGTAIGIQASAPVTARFKLANDPGQTHDPNLQFVLLDSNGTSPSKYFVATINRYGSAQFDSAVVTEKFDPNSSSNIAYLLNHQIASSTGYSQTSSGVTTTYKLPAGIINNIDANHVWLTEAGLPTGPCPNDYISTCGVAIMSVNEMLTYKEKLGYQDAGAWLWTRTGVNNNDHVILGIRDTSNWGTTGRDDWWGIRPCFWLGTDFFKTVKLDVASMGADIKIAILANYTRSDLQGIYTNAELVAIGYPAVADPNITVSNLAISGTLKPAYTINATYSWGSSNHFPEGTSICKWYRCDTAGDTGTEVGTGKTYTLTEADGGKYIKFSIVPQDTQGGFGPTQKISSLVAAPLTKALGGNPSGLPSTGDSKYRFTLQSDPTKQFILLDSSSPNPASKYFVLTYDNYGGHYWDKTVNLNQKFDLSSPDNMAYFLNHDFIANGNGSATYKLPDQIVSNIDSNHVWLTEGGIAGGPCPEDYLTTCGISLMSTSELITYAGKCGWKDNTGANYIWTRSPASQAGNCILGFKENDNWSWTGRDDNWAIRPCFYLGRDFFKTVKLDIPSMGSEVKKAIVANYAIPEFITGSGSLYTPEELNAMGFDPYQAYNVTYTNGATTVTDLTKTSSVTVNVNFISYNAPTSVLMITILYNEKGAVAKMVATPGSASANVALPISTTINMSGLTVNAKYRLETYFWKDLTSMKVLTKPVNFIAY